MNAKNTDARQRQQAGAVGSTKRNGLGLGITGLVTDEHERRSRRPGAKRRSNDALGRKYYAYGHSAEERRAHRAWFAAIVKTLAPEEKFIFECRYGDRDWGEVFGHKRLTLAQISDVTGLPMARVEKISAALTQRLYGRDEPKPERFCSVCGGALAGREAKYCSARCKETAKKRRKRARRA